MAQNGKVNGASSGDLGAAAHRKCPACGKPTQEKVRPFCSLRCANLDLGNWLDERYVLPGDDSGEDIDDAGGGEDMEGGEEGGGE